MPITSLVIKVASRCNLNCRYCYMYNLGDNTYKNQPKTMSLEVVDRLMDKVKEHCLAHDIKNFSFILHGGEPLLAGKNFFKYFKDKAVEILGGFTNISLGIQTNAVLLNSDWCKLLGELGYKIGISLDGTQENNDAFRVDHAGNGAYNAIVRGLKNAQLCTVLESPGILSVVNVNSNPLAIYDHFKFLNIEGYDCLLPDANYDHPPPPAYDTDSTTPYADWFIKLFDKWFYEESDDVIGISFFDSFIDNLLGSESKPDNMGRGENRILIIETNGGIEAVDMLKICGDGFTKDTANVLTHSFDEAMQTPLAKLYRNSGAMLCKKCLACPINETCGGGYIPHRYSSVNGFNNPSVYCKDLMKLITHIQNRIWESMPEDIVKDSGVQQLTFEQVQEIIEHRIKEVEEPVYIQELLNN